MPIRAHRAFSPCNIPGRLHKVKADPGARDPGRGPTQSYDANNASNCRAQTENKPRHTDACVNLPRAKLENALTSAQVGSRGL